MIELPLQLSLKSMMHHGFHPLCSNTAPDTVPASALAPMLRAGRHYSLRHRRRRQQQERPPPHWFTLGTFRTFGNRLCNPPPPTKEERYVWFVSPRFDILLEDVVADKHLPPLSRQDFEDYLQHVEGTVENLYFLEWVQHYRQLYQEWAESVLPGFSGLHSPTAVDLNIPSTSKGVYRSRDLWERLKDCQDRTLREEFAFAKATFFESDATMRLDIGDELRASVLLIPNGPPPQGEHQELTDKLPSFPTQPEPSLFDAILARIDVALAAAFARFLRLAFCNSGLWHSCIGHFVGMCILAGGIAIWSMGIQSRGRTWVAGGLPLIWVGVWFMLVSANGHCLGVWVTGDARQLYPHEVVRPLPADTAPPPPVYSIALPGENDGADTPPATYSFGRNPSNASHILPFASPPTPPPRTYQPFRWSYLNTGRRSEGMGRLFSRRGAQDFTPRDVEGMEMDGKVVEGPAEIESKLPPPRQTKDLPRQSLVLDVEQANELRSGFLPFTVPTETARRGAVVDLSAGWTLPQAVGSQAASGPEGRPDSPFTEENDFGIVVSDAYEGDSPCYPPVPNEATSSRPAASEEPVAQPSGSGLTVEPLPPLIQAPECAGWRRRTLPELFAPGAPHGPSAESVGKSVPDSNSRRGSKTSTDDREAPVLQWPWPRKLFGPMTPIQSPVVRRAQWVITIRTAIVASAVTCGMALGLIR